MFNWLKRAFGISGEVLEGATIDCRNAVEVTAPKDGVSLVTNLANLLPDNATLYFEGNSIRREVAEFLSAHERSRKLKIARGTIWPHPHIYHVDLTREVIEKLADFFSSLNSNEICDHFHAYVEKEVLFQWHDAVGKDPLLLSSRIPEEKIREFCSELGCRYEKMEVHNS